MQCVLVIVCVKKRSKVEKNRKGQMGLINTQVEMNTEKKKRKGTRNTERE